MAELDNPFKVNTHVAVGIILDQQQRILIAKRPCSKVKAGYWEFPGGKVEQNETTEQALIRELQEEVNIKPLAIKPYDQYLLDDGNTILLEVYLIHLFEGTAKGLEGQEIKWEYLQQFHHYSFLKSNQALIDSLRRKLPALCMA